MLDGIIYEEVVTDGYSRLQLPAPQIYSTGYDNEKGKALEKAFQSGSSYEVDGTFLAKAEEGTEGCTYAVSYTHLDVYKRQSHGRLSQIPEDHTDRTFGGQLP